MFKLSYKNPFLLGTNIFFTQLLIILLIHPEKNFFNAWLSFAAHWDSGWYESIATKGYIFTSNEFRQSHGTLIDFVNVAFLPGYPYFARGLILLFGINVKVALLLVSQSATWIFWCLFFHITRAKPLYKQLYAALLIIVFPTSWFMFMGYSESLFVLACCLMLYLTTQKKWVLSGLSAALMTATRIMGVPVLVAPILSNLFIHYSKIKNQITKNDFSFIKQIFSGNLIVVGIGSLGFLGFLLYCQIKFHWWNIYFAIEKSAWGATAEPFFLFKFNTWFPPPFGFPAIYAPPLSNAYDSLFFFKFFRLAAFTFSETLVPLFIWLTVIYAFIFFKKSKTLEFKSLTWFLASALLLFASCMSTFVRDYESMSRLLLPVWITLVISDLLHPEHIFFLRFTKSTKFKLFVGVFVIISFGFWLQLLNRYMLGWWVA